MKKFIISLIVIVALVGNIHIAEAQYAHPANAIKSTNGNVQSDLNTLQSNIGASTVEIGLITAEIDLIQANLATVEASLTALALNDSTQEIEIAAITAEISQMQTNLGTLEDLINEDFAWTTAEIAFITSEIELIQTNLDTIETRLDEHHSNLDTHEISIGALITNDQTQETRIASTEVGLARHENNISNPHSVTATQTSYTDTYLMGVTTVQSALDTIELWLSSINVTNDSQDVAINNINSDIDSAEVAINLNNINDDSQDVQIESNRVAITLKADSDEIHTDISQAYVNVKEFGAVGDGITDDATAINNAIASLTSGGVVLFPAGYYSITSQITLTGKHGITLRGVGHGKNTTYLGTNIYAHGFNGHHFRFIDCVDISVENMNLTAEGQNSSFGVGGLYFSLSSNSNNPYHSFKDLFISDISNGGIAISTPIMNNFKNVTVRKCVGDAFNVWSGTSTSFLNCYANNATETGFILTNMTYSTLQGCAAEGAGVGFYFDNSKSISVMGCGTEAIVDRGGAFNGYAYRSINGSNAITLYDCYDRISETGTFSESAGGLLDYINHKTDSNAQITKIHSLPASTSTYTDTYTLGATNLQTALDTVAVWLNSAELRLDSIEALFVGGIEGQVLTRTADSFTWATPSSGVTDHLLLSNIGTKTHLELEQDITDLQANPAGISKVWIDGVALPTGEVEFVSGDNVTLNVSGSTVEVVATGGTGTGATVEAILSQTYSARSQGTAEVGYFSIFDFDITSSIIVTGTIVPTINGLIQYETNDFTIGTWDDGGTNKLRITFTSDVASDAFVRVSCFTTLPLLAVISAGSVSTTNGWLQGDLDSFENSINAVDGINDSQDVQIEKNRVDVANTYTKAQTNSTIEAAIAAIPETDLSNYYNKAQTESTVAVMIKDNAQAKYWYPLNMTDGDYTGEVIIDSIETSMTAYTAVYYGSSGFANAKADSYTTLPAIGLVLETGTGNKKILTRGILRNDSWDWTKGGRVYVSAATAGALTQTAPTTSTQLVQIIGVALSSDEVLLMPDTTCVEN